MAFWYAIHTENLEQAQIIYTLDPIIEKIMKSIREKGEKDLQIKRYREEEKKKKQRKKDNSDDGSGNENQSEGSK